MRQFFSGVAPPRPPPPPPPKTLPKKRATPKPAPPPRAILETPTEAQAREARARVIAKRRQARANYAQNAGAREKKREEAAVGRAFDRRLAEMKARVIDKQKRRLEAEMRLGRLLRPKRKAGGITKVRMREIEEEKSRRRKRRAFKSREEMVAALNRRTANIVRRTNILQDDDVVAERERLKAIQKLQAAMKARVVRAPIEEDIKRRATEAKAKEKKRLQEGRMRKLAAQGLGNRDQDGHLIWDPRVEAVPLVGVSPPEPSGLTNPASSKVRRPPITRGGAQQAQERENGKFLLYGVFSAGMIQPRVYTVYINKTFTGLTSSREAAVEGHTRWTMFMAYAKLGRFGSTPVLQPYLLGDNTSMFFGYNHLRAGLTQAQKVNLAENLQAIVANHKLDPRTVPPGLRDFIDTRAKRMARRTEPFGTSVVED